MRERDVRLHRYRSNCSFRFQVKEEKREKPSQNTDARRMEMEMRNAPASSGLHHQLAFPLSKGVVELGLVVLVDQVVEPGLSTELVDSLCDFVASCIPETREERYKPLADACSSVFTEDDGRQR